MTGRGRLRVESSGRRLMVDAGAAPHRGRAQPKSSREDSHPSHQRRKVPLCQLDCLRGGSHLVSCPTRQDC